jgi:hypothetical protein
MKQFLLVLALVVGFAAPAMAEGFPDIFSFAVNCDVAADQCK